MRNIDEPLEKDIEAYLCRRVKALGGMPYKFTSPQRRGVPDRLCLFSGARIIFVEVKRGKEELTKLQEYEIAALRSRGFAVAVVRSKEDVDILFPKPVR